MPDSSPAMIQTMVDTRATGMPSSDARSPFSAEARTAMPMSVYRKKAASAAQITAVATPAMMKLPSKTSVPRVKSYFDHGVTNRLDVIRSPVIHSCTLSSKKTSRRETPMVATVAMSLGAERNRRMTSTSVAPPSSAEPTSTIGRTRK